MALRDLRTLWRAGQGCLSHSQLGRAGAVETLSTSAACPGPSKAAVDEASVRTALAARAVKELRTNPNASAALASASASEPDPEVELEAKLQFVSSERASRPAPPERRIPICFPRMTLQMLKLDERQVALLKERGWLREVAFKTSPDVTKLEVSTFLEAVYGMSVERVSTINYLGRRRLTYSGRGKKLEWREDDWKKAYVIFRPPQGNEHWLEAEPEREGKEEEEEEEGAREGQPVIERIRAAARAPRRAPKPYPWEERARAKRKEE